MTFTGAAMVSLFLIGCAGATGDESAATSTSDYSMPVSEIGNCPARDVRAPTLWNGRVAADEMLYDGPGTEYDEHESGAITPAETIYVIGECGDWLQARAMNQTLAEQTLVRTGADSGNEMLSFWLPMAAVIP